MSSFIFLTFLISASIAIAPSNPPKRFVTFPTKKVFEKSLIDAGYKAEFIKDANIVKIVDHRLTFLEANDCLKSRLLDYYNNLSKKQGNSSRSGEPEYMMAMYNKPELLNLLFQDDLEALKILQRSHEYKNEKL